MIGVSLSAVANGLPLPRAVQKAMNICPLSPVPPKLGFHIIELAIGAKPIPDPLYYFRTLSAPAIFTAHHAVPIGDGKLLRPTDKNRELVDRLHAIGIKRYSAHPPTLKSGIDLKRWAMWHYETLGSKGISFAVETMYPIWVNGQLQYHLDSPYEIESFAEWAISHGWKQPLVIDLAHLNIMQSVYPKQWLHECINLDYTQEIHYSGNAGKRDTHVRFDPRKHLKIAEWMKIALDLERKNPETVLLIDEGRVRN